MQTKIKRRLGGWTRIGIVLSGLWLIVGWLVVVNARSNQAGHAYEVFYNACALEKNPAKNCFEEGGNAVVRTFKDYPIGKAYLLKGVLPIPIAWLLIWGIVVMVRWMRRGFAPQ